MTIQQVLLAGAWEAVFALWNLLDKSPDVTVSGGDLVIGSASANNESIRANQGKSSGRWYWEVTIGSPGFGYVGAAQSGHALDNTWIGSGSNGWAYRSDGTRHSNGSSSAYGASFTTGDVIGAALDMTAGTITFYKNGVSQGQAYSGLTGTVYPADTVGAGTNVSHTANFGASAFAYTPPSGFTPVYT